MALSLLNVNGKKKFMMMASNNRATPQVNHGGVHKMIDLVSKGELTIACSQGHDGEGQHKRLFQFVHDEVIEVGPGLGCDFSSEAAQDLIKDARDNDAANGPSEGEGPVLYTVAEKKGLKKVHGVESQGKVRISKLSSALGEHIR
jgi:hypothetical protein